MPRADIIDHRNFTTESDFPEAFVADRSLRNDLAMRPAISFAASERALLIAPHDYAQPRSHDWLA
jgi:hypothetical protein